MAITTAALLQSALAASQLIDINKTGGVNIGTGAFVDMINIAGTAGGAAGTLAGSSTAAGVVPTDATTGFPAITDFPGGNTGYLGRIRAVDNTNALGNSNPRMRIGDMLFKAGAYAFNAAVTLAAQPSYSSRVPGGDYKGTEIWFEKVTTFTGNPTVTVTYTNQDGTAGRSTSLSISSTGGVGHMMQLPLQAGDTGVQKIESVTGTIASAGTFNILVIRPLWQGTGTLFNPVDYGPDKTDLPIIFSDSALHFMLWGLAPADVLLDVING